MNTLEYVGTILRLSVSEGNITLNVSIINHSREFYSLRDEWNDLLKLSQSNTIFLRWEWLYNWWQVYGKGSYRLFIVAVRDNDRLIGIAPFYIKMRLGFFREINFLGSNIVASDYLDFILLKGKGKDVISSILLFLEQHKKYWDVLQLSDVPSNSDNIDLIEQSFQKYKIIINKKYTVCPYIKLNLPWDNIFSSYASILKNTIKQKSKKFERISYSAFDKIKPGHDSADYFSKFLHLNKLSLKRRGIESPFLDKKFLTFHKKIIDELLDKEMVKFYFLKIGTQYIAGIYILVYDCKYYYYQSGFDPAWKKISPGTLLFHYSIKTAHEEGAKEFDFLQGDEAYKSSWTKAKRINASIEVYNDNFKGFFLYLVKYSKDASKRIISLVRKRIFEESKYE